MVTIANAARPTGQRDDYRFFKETESGEMFKSLAETDHVGGDPVLKLSVSQVDANGKALVDENGNAIVSWHSHTITPVELQDPSFDAEARVAVILTTAIGAHQSAQRGREKLDELKAAWSGDKALDLTLPPVVAVVADIRT